MIYELSINGYSLGLFPSEAEALRRVDYLHFRSLYRPGMEQRGRFPDILAFGQ